MLRKEELYYNKLSKYLTSLPSKDKVVFGRNEIASLLKELFDFEVEISFVDEDNKVMEF